MRLSKLQKSLIPKLTLKGGMEQLIYAAGERFPELTQQLISYASQPSSLLKYPLRFKIVENTDQSVKVLAPKSWFSQEGGSGEISHAALVLLVEECLRLFWQRHIDFSHSYFKIKAINYKFLNSHRLPLQAHFELQELQKAELEFKLLQSGKVEDEAVVSLFNSDHQLACQVDLTYELHGLQALS